MELSGLNSLKRRRGFYCLSGVPALVVAKPELKDVELFKTVLWGDRAAIAKLPMQDLEKLLMATLSGMTIDRFWSDVKTGRASARVDPRWKRPYTELRINPCRRSSATFVTTASRTTYIVTVVASVSVRVFSEQTYGIPPEQVVGSMGGVTYSHDANGKPVRIKEPNLVLNDNLAGKVEGIHMVIGRSTRCSLWEYAR